ncbi:uncharacterized protein BX663DRAFT_501186 [Cokeromyces recurvatus]|uniref:uncharacterized protein n=1 Tax=Cokeromyces recurvatus TaxID=90255 RepID=UPI00221E5578|nr:uncharacterized protein BX663DRAFT_501186 [Cokeromyces recurvatus]KAI7904964.1 hypothetical protein BX663DRAFT_501186 [Cokeromyces recurvatus]
MSEEAKPHKDVWFHIKHWKIILPIAYVTSLLYMIISLSGVFYQVEDYNMENCVKIEGPSEFTQCEDFVLSKEDDVAYVGCDPIRIKYNKVMGINHLSSNEPVIQGAIWKVNYTETPANIEKFKLVGPENVLADFHPLGMALDVHPVTGEKTLFIMNLAHHAPSSIELFSLNGDTLVHKHTIQHPKIYSPNSLHILNDIQYRSPLDGTPSFFFSNDHYFSNKNFISILLKKIENYILYFSNVGIYNARTGQVEKGVNGLLFANGLAGTDDILFVSETHKRMIRQYKIVKKKGRIELDYVSKTKFKMAVDNLHYEKTKGWVIVAGHPKPLKFIKYILRYQHQKPPSQVAVWDVNSGKTSLIIQDDGALFGSSTTAAFDLKNSKLIVSGLYEDGLLVCDV